MSSNGTVNEESTDDKDHFDNINQPLGIGDIDIEIADNRDASERYDRFGQQIIKGGKRHRLSFKDQIEGHGKLEEVLHVDNLKNYNSFTVQ